MHDVFPYQRVLQAIPWWRISEAASTRCFSEIRSPWCLATKSVSRINELFRKLSRHAMERSEPVSEQYPLRPLTSSRSFSIDEAGARTRSSIGGSSSRGESTIPEDPYGGLSSNAVAGSSNSGWLSSSRAGRKKKSRLSDGGDDLQATLLDDAEMEHDRLLGDQPPDERSTTAKTSSNVTASSARTIRFGPSATLSVGKGSKSRPVFPPNVLRNQKYSFMTFIPLVLYEQFKFFFNLYFLLVALSQFVPALKIGFIATYIAPLAFVLCVTMGKEAYDDYQRHLRDREANSARYLILDRAALANMTVAAESASLLSRSVPSSKLKVGDIVMLEKNMRVPADMALLRTSETVATSASMELDPQPVASEPASSEDASGSCFVRTDQLDGETDWKLRLAVSTTQGMSDAQLLEMSGELYADPPIKDIHTFIGNLSIASPSSPEHHINPLSAENMLWANTILAAGSAVGMVVYTGRETRAAMNTSEPETKVGLLDMEINWIAKILCSVTFALSVFLVGLNGFRGTWFVYIFRFLILFSSIIPISLRVNLDMGKTVYAREIQNDSDIPGAIVRTSTLPEELGRIQYLLTDKTGTLTQNGQSDRLVRKSGC